MKEKLSIDIEQLKRGGVVKLKEKDMFSMWVKTYCGNLNSAQLRKVADLAKKYGRGLIHFSTRQIPIIPFIRLENVEVIKEELKKVEVDLDRCGSRVRNINVCYENKICDTAVTDCLSLGEKLEKYFYDSLLHKTKIGIVGCKKDCVASRVLNDLCFIGMGKDAKGDYYDVYLGGRLGLNPFVGRKMAGPIPEDKCAKFVENYFNLMKNEGKEKERSADLINRLGEDVIRERLTKDLEETDISKIDCRTRLKKKELNKEILKIRVTNGEITSEQLRFISDLAEKYGNGFVHFTIYGSPEIPCVDKKKVSEIQQELKSVGLELIENKGLACRQTGIDNLQACFGGYCTNGIFDAQSLLKKVEKLVSDVGLNNPEIKISAAGCPNSCGIAHLSDIGFLGVVEPEVDREKCNGCSICEKICKKKAIKIIGKLALIDKIKCASCGECIRGCPFDAIYEKRKGIAVLVGGSYGERTELGEVVAEFLTEEEALKVTKRILELFKNKNVKARKIIDEMGIEKFIKL